MVAVPSAAAVGLLGLWNERMPMPRPAAARSTTSTSSTGVGGLEEDGESGADDGFPRRKWSYNWDSRDPLSMVSAKKYEEADVENKQKMLDALKPTATRNVLLIRHGQYKLDGDVKCLTQLGREQALLLGQRLAASGVKWDSVTISTMTRALETAQIICDVLPAGFRQATDSVLEEGAPYPPEPPVQHWTPKHHKLYTEGSRIEAAFRKYIHRASVKQKADSYELVVCHANVIRYFICRALQFPPEGWLRIALGNCSITWIVIRPNGNVAVRCVGDVGHLTPDKVSFT